MKRYALVLAATVLLVGIAHASASTRIARAHIAAAMAAATGTLTGIITDPVSNRPLAHALVTVGYLTPGFQRTGETDAHGRYTITGLPATSAQGIDSYAFAEGYFYHHGLNQVIRAGRTTTYSFSIARDTFVVSHPRVLSHYATIVNHTTVKFGMAAIEGTGPFSFEMLAVSPQLGYLAVLTHGPGTHYDGTFTVPRGTKRGRYRFFYIATQNDCFTNQKFPYTDVQLG